MRFGKGRKVIDNTYILNNVVKREIVRRNNSGDVCRLKDDV